MTTTHCITFSEESLAIALNQVQGLHELSADLIAGDVFRMSPTTVGHDCSTPAAGVTDSDMDRLVETVACLVTYAEDEAAATCDDEENSEKAWDAADKARALLEELARKRTAVRTSNGSPTAARWEHGLDQAEGVQPDLNILHVGAPCTAAAVGHRQNEAEGCITAASAPMHDLDKAEGEQPDLNFHLLQLAERSCSLLEDWVQLTDTADETLTEQIKATRTLLQSQSPTWSTAVRDLLAERRRQIAKGYSAEHDDHYGLDELAAYGAVHALLATDTNSDWRLLRTISPWEVKPDAPRTLMVKAAALMLAALESLDRSTERARKAAELGRLRQPGQEVYREN